MAKNTNPKYRIKELVESMPRNINVAEELEERGITPSTHSRDLKAGMPGAVLQDIPGDRLKIYSEFFGISIEQLYTVQPKVKKAISSNLKTSLS
jgi:hypothetical protein